MGGVLVNGITACSDSPFQFGHSEKAQGHIYLIKGELVLHTEMGEYLACRRRP